MSTKPESNDERSEIKVTDRRRVSPDGSLRQTETTETTGADKPSPTNDEDRSTQPEPPGHDRSPEDKSPFNHPLPRIDFPGLIISLYHSGLYHLGEVEAEGESTNPKVDLLLAKQFIDILQMLKEKTRGNLEKEEERLLQTILYDLQMKYVAKL